MKSSVALGGVQAGSVKITLALWKSTIQLHTMRYLVINVQEYYSGGVSMLARFKAGIKVLRGLHAPDRNLKILPDDRFLVSYPKSGNTWVRFLVANLLHPETPAN